MKKKLLLVLILLLVVGCGHKKEEIKTYDVTKKGVIEDKMVDGINFTNTSLTVENGVSRFITRVTNNTDEDYVLKEYTIIFKDKDNNVLASVPGYVEGVIKAGESKNLDSSIDRDLSKTFSVEYEVLK